MTSPFSAHLNTPAPDSGELAKGAFLATSTMRIVEIFMIGLAPVLAWFLFGVVLINQDIGDVDPWIYTGYGRIFPIMHAQFGWPYYAVRFPVVALNEFVSISSRVAGLSPVAGYAVLRYLLLLLCGVPLYAWARQTFGPWVAVVSYLFLFCNPLLPRVLLWDLTPFVSVPMALAGMAVWLWSDRWSTTGRFLSGICWMAAVASHVFTGTAVGTFVLVQLVRRIRAREFRQLLRDDVLMTGIGAAVCYALGCAYYFVRVGPFDPSLIVTISASVISAGHMYAGSHQAPFLSWAATEYHVYVPMLCVVLAGALLGRRIWRNTPASSIWWFGTSYTIVYLVYQFVVGRFVLQVFYYFGHLTLVVFLLVPVILSELTRSLPEPSKRSALGCATLGLVVLPLLAHLEPSLADRLAGAASGNFGVLITLGLIVAVFVSVAPWLTRRRSGALAALVVMVLLAQTLTLLNPFHRYVFDSRHRARERDVYVAAVEMLDVFGAYARPNARVMLWYCPGQASLTMIASSVLLFTMQNPWVVPHDCEGHIGDYERTRLHGYPVRYVLMLDEQNRSFAGREAALGREGYLTHEMLSTTIGGGTYHAALRLVEIERRKP